MTEKDHFKRETFRRNLKCAVSKTQRLTQKKQEQFNSPVLTRPTSAADQQRWTLLPPRHCAIGDVTHRENRLL